jgi:AraC-like DNA-binding protein
MNAAIVLPPPSALATGVTAWNAREFAVERARVAVPRTEAQLVVRFGPAARDGVDVHVLGAQQQVRRKFIRGVQRSLMVHCGLGSTVRLFGASATELAGRVAPLELLWGAAATDALRERLATTDDAAQAFAIVEGAMARRGAGDAPSSVVAEAARRLASASVRAVAQQLGLSERHLRRLFHEAAGMSPKRYERIARFGRAIRHAGADDGATWADVAVEAGYYDQAHLIADFRAIAGTTPAAFLRELGDER